jgi:hypothetical protein
LAKGTEKDTTMTYSEKHYWKAVKEQGRKLFDPHLGGYVSLREATGQDSNVLIVQSQRNVWFH